MSSFNVPFITVAPAKHATLKSLLALVELNAPLMSILDKLSVGDKPLDATFV